jgi:hypothetical protein
MSAGSAPSVSMLLRPSCSDAASIALSRLGHGARASSPCEVLASRPGACPVPRCRSARPPKDLSRSQQQPATNPRHAWQPVGIPCAPRLDPCGNSHDAGRGSSAAGWELRAVHYLRTEKGCWLTFSSRYLADPVERILTLNRWLSRLLSRMRQGARRPPYGAGPIRWCLNSEADSDIGGDDFASGTLCRRVPFPFSTRPRRVAVLREHGGCRRHGPWRLRTACRCSPGRTVGFGRRHSRMPSTA